MIEKPIWSEGEEIVLVLAPISREEAKSQCSLEIGLSFPAFGVRLVVKIKLAKIQKPFFKTVIVTRLSGVVGDTKSGVSSKEGDKVRKKAAKTLHGRNYIYCAPKAENHD